MAKKKGTIRGYASPQWQQSSQPGRLFSQLDDGRIECHLSPRNCKMKEGQAGFCRVRVNKGGELHTLNYGKSVNITEESIETEAVFHYMPGARILSLGNIGCMMNCDYCHNWKTSQARYVEDKDVHEYTPEQIVAKAEARDIPILSWTYNDPVVWHEFVLDTSLLAHKRGLKNLYKSAFFISMEGAAELCDVIDIFSISIKTMDETLYRKISKGWLPPVLEATQYVFEQGKHVEISNLMVTDANDSETDAEAIAAWILENLSDEVPLHFVRFHPDYKYTHVGRTPIERLVKARKVAMEMGIKHCYLGNVYGNEGTSTSCSNCGHLLIERYGLNTWVRGLSTDGNCVQCSSPISVNLMSNPQQPKAKMKSEDIESTLLRERLYEWHGDVNACHVEIENEGTETMEIYYWHREKDGSRSGPFSIHIHIQESHRFIISKASPDEVGIIIEYPTHVRLKLYEVFDRAHYPTVELEESEKSTSDTVPFPYYIPRSKQLGRS